MVVFCRDGARVVLAFVVALFALFYGPEIYAQSYGDAEEALQIEIGAGASWTSSGSATPIASLAWLPALRPMDGAQLRWDLGAVHVRGRGSLRPQHADDVTVFHAGLRYERSDNGLTLGFGVGAQTGETNALSGEPQFVSTVGWRWRRFSLLGRHISNAGFDNPNRGETMLVAAWRF